MKLGDHFMHNNIAMDMGTSSPKQKMILEVWHLAHDFKRHIFENMQEER